MIDSPHFALTDHHSRRVTEATFDGTSRLVLFGFTHCRVVCPRALRRTSAALEALGDAGRNLQGLYITVDPARDTPQQLAGFLAAHPRFLGLTGTEAECVAARREFGVAAHRREDPEDPDGYAMPHTAATYLLDRSGVYLRHWLDSVSEQRLVDELRDEAQRGRL